VSLVWQCGPLLTLGIVLLSLLLGAAPVISFVVTKHVVNAMVGASGHGPGWSSLLPWLAALVGVLVGRLAADQLREVQRMDLKESLDAWINERIAAAGCRVELAELQTAEFQDTLDRARGVTGDSLDEVVWWLVHSVQSFLAGVSLGALLWRYQPLAAALPCFGGAAMWLGWKRFNADVYENYAAQTPRRRERDALEAILSDRTVGKEIRLYQAAPHWLDRWQSLFRDVIREHQAVEQQRWRARLSLDALRSFFYAGALLVLVRMALHGGLSVGSYVALAAAVVELEGLWDGVLEYLHTIPFTMQRLARDLFPLLDRLDDHRPRVQIRPGGTRSAELGASAPEDADRRSALRQSLHRWAQKAGPHPGESHQRCGER
jgi:ABC-type bacteriocin/lantibiotic exporter with double-glycine peptidase domain